MKLNNNKKEIDFRQNRPITMGKMRTLIVSSVLLAMLGSVSCQLEIPCAEFHPALAFPCLCGLNDVNATKINCDGAVFPDFPVLPYRFYIQEFSQKQAGLQTLGAQLFTASDIPLKVADFSDNQVRRLTERLFDGVEDTIEVILLGNNLLGDNLNPVFSSGEFQNLKFLRQLDLSYNHFIGIEEGLLDGCTELKVRIKSSVSIITGKTQEIDRVEYVTFNADLVLMYLDR